MADLALRLGPVDEYLADLAIESDDLASDAGLQTAILLSLATDRRANDDDPLPTGNGDKRGWWADQFADVDGDKFGSRLWLIERKVTTDVETVASAYASESLQWLVDDLVADAIEVDASYANGVLEFAIVVARPTGERVSFRFDHIWEGQLAL